MTPRPPDDDALPRTAPEVCEHLAVLAGGDHVRIEVTDDDETTRTVTGTVVHATATALGASRVFVDEDDDTRYRLAENTDGDRVRVVRVEPDESETFVGVLTALERP